MLHIFPKHRDLEAVVVFVLGLLLEANTEVAEGYVPMARQPGQSIVARSITSPRPVDVHVEVGLLGRDPSVATWWDPAGS